MSEQSSPPLSPPPSLPEETGPIVHLKHRWVCPRCGADDLAAGYLVDYGEKFQHIYLAPRRLKFKRLRHMLRPFRNLTKVNADVCRNCGMVILEVDTEEFEEAEERFGRS